MDKRDFLKGAAKLAALSPLGAAAATDKRLFGTPASVSPIDPAQQNKLRLTFARNALPTPIWDRMAGLVAAITQLQASPDARKRFAASARGYFESYGLATNEHFAQSREVAMASLVMDADAIKASREGDYVRFMQKIKDYSLPVLPDASLLTQELTSLLRKDVAAYRTVKASIDKARGGSSAQTLAALQQAGSSVSVISPADSAMVYTETHAVVSTVAIAYTLVGAVLVAIAAAYATVIAVAAGTPGGGGGGGGGCDEDCPPIEEEGIGVGQIGELSKLDPRVLEAADMATTAARILGNKGFEVHIVKDILAREIEALLGAAETVGLVTISPGDRPAVLSATVAAAHRSYGLAA